MHLTETFAPLALKTGSWQGYGERGGPGALLVGM